MVANSMNMDENGAQTFNITTGDLKGSATTQYNVLVGDTNNKLTNVAPSATSGIPLISQGSSANPVFGTAVVAGGGTGATSFTAYSVITGGTTSTGALQNVSGVGTSGQVLTSNGAGTLPTWQASSGDLTSGCCFDASRTAGVPSITGDGTVYLVTFNINHINNGSNWNGTSTFTAPATGLYYFSTNIQFTNVTASFTFGRVNIETTSKTYTYQMSPSKTFNPTNSNVSVCFTILSYMLISETAKVRVMVSGGTKTVGVSNQLFSGFRVA